MSVDYAKLEAKMFRFQEITDTQSKLKFEKEAIRNQIGKMVREAGGFEHVAKFDENFELIATIKEGTKNVFDAEDMANDLKVEKAATKRKDFLINMTEQKKLTLNRFKQYFHREPETKIEIRKKKIKKKKSKGQ